MVLRHVQEANTLVNRQNIRYNILSGTLVPYRAINRHISTKQDLPRCSLCGFAVDICKRYVVLFNVKIFKKEIPHGRTAYKNRRIRREGNGIYVLYLAQRRQKSIIIVG